MKKNTILFRNKMKWVAGVLMMGATLSMTQSCTEEIDDSNFAIKDQQTATDYLDDNEDFSLIRELLKRAKLGNSEGASSLYNVLSARGNYTIFLPNNAAIEKYLDENGLTSIDELTGEQLDLVAKSGILDHENNHAYETPDFPTTGAFIVPNLNDRILFCNMDSTSHYIINGTSRVVREDIEVSNGMIHVVETVVAPSAMTLDRQIDAADNLKVFSYLMHKTTWSDSLYENLDKSYENPDRVPRKHLGEFVYTHAVHRYVGYTAMVEPDSVYEKELGMKAEYDAEGNLVNGEQFVQRIAEFVRPSYGDAEMGDCTHPDNPVNRFVAYHLLYGKMPYNRLVYHYNEYGYKYGDWKSPQMIKLPTNVWEFYTTMGQHPSLVKITQVGDGGFEHDVEHPIYLNRISQYADGPEDDYRELGVEPGYAGILVSPDNGENDNNSLNGFYLPINQLLVMTPGLRDELYKRRIRMDISATFPELATNNVRGDSKTCFEFGYLERVVKQNSSTIMGYSHPQGSGWMSIWGDEFRVFGLYDFTYQLPPVPRDGTYEIRMGCAHGPIRGMCQIYFGSDPERLKPTGLPYDMRQTPGPDNVAIPWIKDVEDQSVNRENDKNLRNQGYLKGPNYFTVSNGNAELTLRAQPDWTPIRRIITTAYMEAGKTYYLRFKSALKKTDAELNIDYFEYVSPLIYNGVQGEDIW